jgi:hypothetical protein
VLDVYHKAIHPTKEEAAKPKNPKKKSHDMEL